MSHADYEHPDPAVAALAKVIHDSGILGCGCCGAYDPRHPDGTVCQHDIWLEPNACGGDAWPRPVALALVALGHLGAQS